jgi:hypothetical protein
MSDIAELGLAVRSDGVVVAKNRLHDLTGAAKRADQAAHSLSSRFKIVAAAIGVAFVGALAGAVAALHKFISATVQQQKVVAQLEATVKSTGAAAGYSADQILAMAGALQKVTSYGDETIAQGQAILLTFTKIGHDVFPQATETMLDMATALGTDLKSAALQLGKALNDPITQITYLRRSGVSFSEAQQKVIKSLAETGHLAEAQKLILKELQVEFGGSARAARNTLGGALDALGNAWGDLFELSGKSTEGIVGNVNDLTDNLTSQDTKAAFETFGNWMISAANGMVGAVVTVINAVQRLNDLMSNNANKSTAGLEERIRSLGIEGVGIENRLMKLNRELSDMAPGARTAFAGEITNLERSRADNLAERARILDELAKRNTPAETAPTVPGISLGGGGGGVGGPTKAQQKAADAYDKIIKSAQQRIVQAGIEVRALGMTAEAANRLRIEQELLNKAANDNIKLTPAQTAQLQGLATATAAAEERTRLLTQAANDNAQIWGAVQDGASGFIKTLVRGGNVLDMLGDKLLNISDMLIDMAVRDLFSAAFGGTNPLNSLLGLGGGGFAASAPVNPFSMSFAGGGYTGNGPRSGGVDGQGGFRAILHPRETVTDHTIANGNSSSDVYVTFEKIELHGVATEEDGAAFARGVSRELRKQLPDAIESYNSNPLRRPA